jgi:hypothetical protein
MSEAPKRRSVFAFLGPALIVASLCAGGGAMLQSRHDDKVAAKRAKDAASDLKLEREAAQRREAHLGELLETQRKANEKDARDRHANFRGFADRAAGVRNDLEAKLAASHRAGDVCTGRIAGIAEDVGELSDLFDRSVGFLERGQAEIGKLQAENHRLAGQVLGWQERDRSMSCIARITVTAPKQ